LIQHFLYQRHYSSTYIREYVRYGLLALIAAQSFRIFFDLGDTIRQLAYDYPQWEGGPAKAMLQSSIQTNWLKFEILRYPGNGIQETTGVTSLSHTSEMPEPRTSIMSP
jgi:hypothetical protein